MSPLVSIIIPVFNRPETFRRSLDSALKQMYQDIEIIVVDDGSSPAIDVQHSGVQLFRQENKGAPAARNFGFTKSKGDYVIFWDADLIAEPEMIEKMFKTLQNNLAASYVYCDFYFGGKKMPARPFAADALRNINYITMASLIRRADFPGFDESLKKFQDWDVWLTMLEKNKTGVYMPEYLFSVEPGGTMSTWLPKFMYRAPWKWLPGVRGKVEEYDEARRIIVEKHDVGR